jgi:fused signal recognition particle receptor
MGIFSKFLSKIKVTELLHKPDLDELADELIAADIGADLAHAIIEQVQKMKSATPEESLHTVLLSHLSKKERTISTASGVTAVMVVGVNGTGKTTSVAKLAHNFQHRGTVADLGSKNWR